MLLVVNWAKAMVLPDCHLLLMAACFQRCLCLKAMKALHA